MIPKTIHYFWFGGNPMTDEVKKCIKSWHELCPEYEIKQWNEENYDYRKNEFMNKAAEAGKWSFVTDYARLDVIYNYGGVYLDTDVEIIRPLDELLKYKAYFGFETDATINTGLGFGSEKGNILLKKMMERYNGLDFIELNQLAKYCCPIIQTPILEKAGVRLNGKKQVINEMIILPKEVLCPLDYDTGKLEITTYTYSIHWFQGSWKTEKEREIQKLWQKLTPIFGKKNAGHIAVILGYPRYYGIRETIKYYAKKFKEQSSEKQ